MAEGINFELSDSQRVLRERAKEFAEASIFPVADRHDAEGSFPWEILATARKAGLRNLCAPISLGGLGLDVLEGCLVVEEIGRGCGGVANAFAINEVAALPILIAGTEDQKRKWVGALCEGQLATFALTEPDAGSDLSRISATAVRRGGEYELNGIKTLISNVNESDFFFLFALTDPAAGLKGLSGFIVPRKTNGVRISKVFDKMGQRASDTGEITLNDAIVPADFRIGEEGEGYSLAMRAFGGARPWTAAAAIGVGQRAFEESVRYAKTREAFGQQIWRHQGVGHKLAEMAMHLEAARLLMWMAAWGVDRGTPDVKALAYAKTFAADSVMQICLDAVQIFGGYGYMRDRPVEKLMRDAKAFQIYDGTSEIQRTVIARELCRDDAPAKARPSGGGNRE